MRPWGMGMLANTRWSRQRLRRLLYRGFFALLVYLFSMVAHPTRRCGSAFPLASTYERDTQKLYVFSA
jgi:hypothetical protein